MRNPNEVVWRPTLDNHLESHFVKLNLADRGLALWIRFTFHVPKGAPRDARCEVWAVFFDANRPDRIVGIKNPYPASEALVDFDAPKMEVADSVFEPPRTEGRVEGNGRSISWKIDWTPRAEPLLHLPYESMYSTKLPRSKTTSPYPHALATGFFEVDSERFEFSDAPMMQGHNWGTKHLIHSVWAHSNCFEGRSDVYFEGMSARMKLDPLAPFYSLAFLYRDGVLIRFDTPQSLLSGPVELAHDMWRFTIKGRGYALDGEISAPKELFAAFRYYNPDGSFSYCLNSGLASAHLVLREIESGRVVDELFSPNACSLEVHTASEEHGVRVFA